MSPLNIYKTNIGDIFPKHSLLGVSGYMKATTTCPLAEARNLGILPFPQPPIHQTGHSVLLLLSPLTQSYHATQTTVLKLNLDFNSTLPSRTLLLPLFNLVNLTLTFTLHTTVLNCSRKLIITLP